MHRAGKEQNTSLSPVSLFRKFGMDITAGDLLLHHDVSYFSLKLSGERYIMKLEIMRIASLVTGKMA